LPRGLVIVESCEPDMQSADSRVASRREQRTAASEVQGLVHKAQE